MGEFWRVLFLMRLWVLNLMRDILCAKKAALVSKERNFDSAIFEDEFRLGQDYDELESEDDSFETIAAAGAVKHFFVFGDL